MPRSIWNGVISFGMVSIPVKLYTATEDKDISFRQLQKLSLPSARLSVIPDIARWNA